MTMKTQKIKNFLRSISAKLILPNIIIFISFLLILSYVMYRPLRDTIILQARENQQSILDEVTSSLSKNLDNALNLTSVLYYAPHHVQQMMDDYENGISTLENYFLSITNVNDSIFSIKLCTPDNSYYVHQNTRRYTVLPDTPDSYDYWSLLLHRAHGRPRVVNVSAGNMKSSGNAYITIAREIYADDGSKIGILLLDVDIQGPFDYFTGSFLDNPYVSRPDNGAYGSFLLLDENNGILYQTDIITNEFLDGLIHSASSGEFRDSNETYMVLKSSTSALDWPIYYYVPQSILLSSLSQTTKIIVACTSLITLLSLVIIIAVSKNISSRINSLVQGIHTFKLTRKPCMLQPKGHDEISTLTNEFSDMTQEIFNLVQQVYVLQIKQKEAAFNALKAQIDPHFINNALQNIQMMAAMHSEPEISNAIADLGMLLRRNLDFKTDYTTVEDELAFLQSYVSLMQFRFQGGLSFVTNTTPDIRGCSILRFLLQPIVENAVQHGFTQSTAEAKISIDIDKCDDMLRIRIADNGIGMSPSKLAALQKALVEQEHLPSEHIGLQNVSSRIRLAHGDKYGLSIESAQNAGTVVTLTLPLLL